MNDSLKLIIDNWSQMVVLLGAIGFIIGQLIKWKFKNKEIRQTVFQTAKYQAIERYMDCHTVFTRKLVDNKIGDIILDPQSSTINSLHKLSNAIEHERLNLESATNKMILYFEDTTYSNFENATGLLLEHYQFYVKTIMMPIEKRLGNDDFARKNQQHLTDCLRKSQGLLFGVIKDLKKEFK